MKEAIIRKIKSHPKLYRKTVEIVSRISRGKTNHKLFRGICNIIVAKKMVRAENLSVRKYAKEKGSPIVTEEEMQKRPVFIPANDPVREEEQIQYYKTPSIYYTVLSDVRILGENNVILADSYCLNDKYELSYHSEFEFQTGNVRKYQKDVSSVEIDRNCRNIDSGIFLVGEAANNFYHWVFDLMSRMVYVNRHEELAHIPLLVDETVARHPTCLRLLRIMDDYHHTVMYIKKNRGYKIKMLHYFSPCSWSCVYQAKNNPGIHPARFAKPKFVIEEYRRHMQKRWGVIGEKEFHSHGKRMFITRGPGVMKRLVNEDELAKLSLQYGFQLYDPSKESIEQQAYDFYHAEYIIAASGAALVNLMWCNRAAEVICISPAQWEDFNYSTLAYLSGAHCTYLDGELLEGTRHCVDVKLLIKCLERLGLTKKAGE